MKIEINIIDHNEPMFAIAKVRADHNIIVNMSKNLIDIAVYGKAMSNGYPMAAVVGKRDVMNAAQSTFISSTYWTERIGPVASIATINKMQENNVPSHICKIGDMIRAGWEELAQENGLKYIRKIYLRSPHSFLNMKRARHCTHYSLRRC